MTPCPSTSTAAYHQSCSMSSGNDADAESLLGPTNDDDDDLRRPLHLTNDGDEDNSNVLDHHRNAPSSSSSKAALSSSSSHTPCHYYRCKSSHHHQIKNHKQQQPHQRKPPLSYNNKGGLGRIRFGQAYSCMVVSSMLIYWTFVSLVPMYNKFFFQKTLFPYPIATAGIQLAVVSWLLAVWNTLQHYCCQYCMMGGRLQRSHCGKHHPQFAATATTTTCSSSCCYQPDSSPPSWIFGPHLWWKVKWCFPIGALFGLKYAMTNLGLHLVPAPTHLLLQSTDLVWTVLSAWWINGEAISAVEMVSLGGCVAGSVVLGWQLNSESTMTAPLYAVAVNLVSPILLGLCLATLRLACTELMRPDNRVGGTVSSVELTSIKLAVSSAVGLMMAYLMEGGDETRDPWWVAFAGLSKSTRWGVLGGALLISVFQVNCTFLTFLTSAVALGLVGQVKIIPQWLLAALSSSRSTNFQFHILNLVGAVLIMGSAAAFAVFNCIQTPPSFLAECSHVGNIDEEIGDYSTNDTEADCYGRGEAQPLLLVNDANDFGAAVVARQNYYTMNRTNVMGIICEDGTADIATASNISQWCHSFAANYCST